MKVKIKLREKGPTGERIKRIEKIYYLKADTIKQAYETLKKDSLILNSRFNIVWIGEVK